MKLTNEQIAELLKIIEPTGETRLAIRSAFEELLELRAEVAELRKGKK